MAIKIAQGRGCGTAPASVLILRFQCPLQSTQTSNEADETGGCGHLVMVPTANICGLCGEPGATLAAVAARKLEDAEAFADELGCERAYGGDNAYADICADPEM